jgi:PAS domain S-box-containing protein
MKRAQKEFLAIIFENALDAVLLMDSKGFITGWNKQAEQIFGWSRDEAVGRLMYETIVPERFRKQHIQGMHHFISTGEGPVLNTRIEIFALRRDGSEFPIELTISPIKTTDGYEFSSFIRDISKRKQAESALRESEEKLRGLYELSPLGIALTDMKGHYVEFNEAFQRICGYTREELNALDYWTLTPKKYEAQEAQQLDSLARTGRYGPYEKEYVRKDGSLIPLNLNGVLVTGRDGEKYIWSIVEDISASKQAEEELRIAAIAFESQEGMVVTDANGIILRVNHAFTQLTGYSAEEVKGKTPAILQSGHQDNAFYQQMWANLKHKHYWHGEVWNKHKNGNVYIELLTISAVKAPDGSITHFIASFADITERKRMEKEILERRNEMDFLQKQHIAAQTAAAIAHELNQPLLAIATYSEAALMLMNAEIPNSEKIRSAIEKCERQAQRAGQSIREMLELLSDKEFPTEAFDINTEITEVLNTASTEHELQFHSVLQLENGLPFILANRIHVQKVLFNLLHNSIDAMIDAGVALPAITVTVRTMKNENVAQVTIQDNGPGIKREDFQRLFEPFFTTKTKGLGMGLAISRSLIEENGGQLWIDPQEGPGATFHLTLPFAT